MRLTGDEIWTDQEWSLAVDVRAVQQHGGRLSLREQQLARVCGSAERALQVLAAVARAERQLDALLEVPATAPMFNIRPVPQCATAASSQVPTRAGRTAAPARVEIAAAAICAAGFAMSAMQSFRGIR